jgi:hypothetical protein
MSFYSECLIAKVFDCGLSLCVVETLSHIFVFIVYQNQSRYSSATLWREGSISVYFDTKCLRVIAPMLNVFLKLLIH